MNDNDKESIHTNINTQKTRQTLASIVIGSSFLGKISLISPFTIMQLSSLLPYMSTPRRKVLATLEEVTY